MNALLLISILLYCRYPEGNNTLCVKRCLECVTEKGAYEMTEKKATEVVSKCLLEPTPQRRNGGG